MPKTFRRTGHVYQRHPINGTPDGVISNPLPKETITGEVFSANTGTGESDRDKFFASGAFLPAANYEGRYVRLHNTPPDGAATSDGRTGFRHEDQICRITSVDPSGDFVRLEGIRFEDDSTVAALDIKMDVFAAADFTAPSAIFPAEPHTNSDAGPVVHQVISLPNPANKTLQLVPFVIGRRASATEVRISDLFGILSTIPAESALEWFLKDRPAYSMRDLFYQFHRFLLDAGWTLVQNRGRWLAGQTTGQNKSYQDDVVYFSDGEDANKRLYLRMVFYHGNNNNNGTDTQQIVGFSWAMFSAWDKDFTPGAGNLDRGEGAGVNPLALQYQVSTGLHFFAGWDYPQNTSNQEPLWNADESEGSMMPFSSNSSHFESDWTKTAQYSNFYPHPLKFPMGGSMHELNYVMFGDKDEVWFWGINDGIGISHVGFGSLEPLPSQIQHSFVTTAKTFSGSNSIIRVGSQDPTSLPSGPSYQVGDNIQVVGQKVNAGHDWELRSHTGEFIETAFIQAIGEVGAVGRIQCVAKALLVDNTDNFTIDDGEGNNITFYYDVDGLGGGTGTAIDVSGDTTAADVATTTAGVLNASALNITFTPNGDVVDAIHNTVNSPATNVAMTEAVQDPGFSVVGMEGSGYGITTDVLNNDYEKGALAGEDPQPNFMAAPLNFSTPFDGSQTNTVRVSNRARHGNVTYFDHNGQSNGQSSGLGFGAVMQQAPVDNYNELDPSTRTNRFGLLGFFVRDTGGNQWRGRMRYLHMLSKRVRPYRFIRDRDGNYYYTIPPKQRRDGTITTLQTATLAIGPMPQGLAIPS